MDEFYRLLAEDNDFNWIPKQGAGRLLRSPTVFEDLVKMICTTNCSWALTEKMVAGLVDTLGRRVDEWTAHLSDTGSDGADARQVLCKEVRAGYRAESFEATRRSRRFRRAPMSKRGSRVHCQRRTSSKKCAG